MSPRSPRQFDEIREETAGRILEGALQTFARLGFAGATVRDVAACAGVSQGLMYHYFRGKEQLLRAVFERSLGQVRASLGADAAGAAATPGIPSIVRAAFAAVRAHPDFWRLTYQLRFQPGVLESLGPRVGGWTGEIRSELERRLRDAGANAPRLQALALFAAIDGAAQHWALEPRSYPIDEVAEAIIAVFSPPEASPTPGER